jgi:perosamine synthetase
MASVDIGAVVRAVLSVAGSPAGHHDAWITDAEREAVVRCLDDVVSYRPVNDLEQTLATRCKVGHAIATSSGSAALEIALATVGVDHGDLVLVPALTFVACANAVAHLGAEPVFLDVRSYDFGVSCHKLKSFLKRECVVEYGAPIHKRTRKRVAALMLVHLLGQPCDVEAICAVANEWRLPIVEDACQALGSSVGEKPCGSWGKVAALSFNYNKIVTGAGGGAVLTNDADVAREAKALATTARRFHPWLMEHNMIAWNYRMPTVCAAILEAQMARLDHFLRCKRALAAAYQEALKGIDGVMFHVEHGGTSNYWLNALMLDPALIPPGSSTRDAVLTALHKQALMARALFTPLHKLPMYEKSDRDNPVLAEDLWRRTVCLPSGPRLGERFL